MIAGLCWIVCGSWDTNWALLGLKSYNCKNCRWLVPWRWPRWAILLLRDRNMRVAKVLTHKLAHKRKTVKMKHNSVNSNSSCSLECLMTFEPHLRLANQLFQQHFSTAWTIFRTQKVSQNIFLQTHCGGFWASNPSDEFPILGTFRLVKQIFSDFICDSFNLANLSL